ncbi:MAG: hypothetical protein HOE90_21790 [Bacteriovoracaceae bacterium]|nr:hypothetical protein [Bacteriovoracaceae bacterium]
MKYLLALACVASFSAYADEEIKTTCNVKNSIDAKECLRIDSYKRYSEGELEHTIGVTRYRRGKKAFEQITGKKPTTKYVGVVEVHYDEDQLLYYEIPVGKNVSPVLVGDYNTADLSEDYYDEDGEVTEGSEYTYALKIKGLEDFHL